MGFFLLLNQFLLNQFTLIVSHHVNLYGPLHDRFIIKRIDTFETLILILLLWPTLKHYEVANMERMGR